MPDLTSPSCSSFYHRRSEADLPLAGIKSNEYEWLSQSSWGETERNWVGSERYNFACNLFLPLKPLRVKGVFRVPEQRVWLFRLAGMEISGLAIFQKTVRGANNWLLFSHPEAGSASDKQLLFRALKSLVSQVLIARNVPVLSVVAEGAWIIAGKELFEEPPLENESDDLLTRIWSPRSHQERLSTAQEVNGGMAQGVFLPCYRTTSDLWFSRFPDAKALPELGSLNRLDRLKRQSVDDTARRKRPGGFMRGLLRFAGRRRKS